MYSSVRAPRSDGVEAQSLEFLPHPSAADAQDHPTVAQDVQGRDLRREVDRVPVWEHEHARAESDPVRDTGDHRKRHQGVEPLDAGRHRDLGAGPLVGVLALAFVGQRDVVRGEYRVEAEPLGCLRHRQDRLLAVAQPDVRQRDGDPHVLSL